MRCPTRLRPQAVTRVESDDAIKAAVLISAKPGSWIAGANIKMLEQINGGGGEGGGGRGGPKIEMKRRNIMDDDDW